MEENRLAVSQDDIEAYFHRLVAIVDGTPAQFVFNADEMGLQEWAGRKKKLVMCHQSILVMRFPSLFRGQARESLLSLVSAPMDLF
jgi:hypothetical protein